MSPIGPYLQLNSPNNFSANRFATSFPGSLFSASLGRWKKDSGCGWSHDHPESGWQKNLLGGRGSRVLCLVDVKNFVGFKSSSSR